MQFGGPGRQLRTQRGLSQRELAASIDASDTYISKVENKSLHFGDYPSERFIHKLAGILDADEEELLLLADKVPAMIRQRVRERPDAFRTLAGVDDSTLDVLLAQLAAGHGKTSPKKPQ